MLADINTGCITSIFSATSIYLVIVFYCVFKEKLSMLKILGVVFIIPCVVFLTMDPKEEAAALETSSMESSLSAEEMSRYGILAVLFGLSAPLLWTFKFTCARRTYERRDFRAFDLGMDSVFFANIYGFIVYAIYLAHNPFKWDEFIEGQIVGVFFLVGMVLDVMAYDYGPGGPINAILSTTMTIT